MSQLDVQNWSWKLRPPPQASKVDDDHNKWVKDYGPSGGDEKHFPRPEEMYIWNQTCTLSVMQRVSWNHSIHANVQTSAIYSTLRSHSLITYVKRFKSLYHIALASWRRSGATGSSAQVMATRPDRSTYTVAQKNCTFPCLMLNWYSFVKSQPNSIIFGRLTPE